jgi:transposase
VELGALQAREILASVRPRDVAGETLRRIAADDPADLIAINSAMLIGCAL